MMNIDRFGARLQTLENEYERGQEQMAFLDQKRAELRDTLLRISGAIQVLKELAAQNGREEPVATAAASTAVAEPVATEAETGP